MNLGGMHKLEEKLTKYKPLYLELIKETKKVVVLEPQPMPSPMPKSQQWAQTIIGSSNVTTPTNPPNIRVGLVAS